MLVAAKNVLPWKGWWSLGSRFHRFKASPRGWIGVKVLSQLFASVFGTERAGRRSFSDRARSDPTVGATGEQPSCGRRTSVAVSDVLKGDVHAVLLDAHSYNVHPQRSLLCGIRFQGGEMDWTAGTI